MRSRAWTAIARMTSSACGWRSRGQHHPHTHVDGVVKYTSQQLCIKLFPGFLVRWFKCKLKPTNSITRDKLRLAIWDTSCLEFLSQIWTQWTLKHILGPILVIFDICPFLTIPGLFGYFQKMGDLRKSKFSR